MGLPRLLHSSVDAERAQDAERDGTSGPKRGLWQDGFSLDCPTGDKGRDSLDSSTGGFTTVAWRIAKFRPLFVERRNGSSLDCVFRRVVEPGGPRAHHGDGSSEATFTRPERDGRKREAVALIALAYL